MSWSACPVAVRQCVPRQNISVPFTPVCWTDAINLNLQTQAPLWLHHLGPTFSSVLSRLLPRDPSKLRHLVRGGQGSDLSSRRPLHPSLPLKPQGLNRLSLREKKHSKRNLIHKLLLTSTSFSYFLHHWVVVEGRECAESLQTHRQRVYTWLSVAVGLD